MNVSNNCSSTNLELHHHVRLIELALYSLIFFFGALFNVLAFWVFSFCSTAAIRNLKKHLNSNSAEEKSIQKAVHIISANLIVFLVCFLPACLGLLAREFHEAFLWPKASTQKPEATHPLQTETC